MFPLFKKPFLVWAMFINFPTPFVGIWAFAVKQRAATRPVAMTAFIVLRLGSRKSVRLLEDPPS